MDIRQEMRSENSDGRLISLAGEILDASRSRLLVNLRYMDMALSFHGRAVYDGTMGTDGKMLFHEPVCVLKTYREAPEAMTRAYLHMVLHCIFHHPFISGDADMRLWDLACDMAVEATIDELALSCTDTGDSDRRQKILKLIRKTSGFLTAERIYAALRSGAPVDRTLERWEELFARDDHSLWRDRGKDSIPAAPADGSQIVLHDDISKAEESWKDIAERMEMDIEMFAKVKGKYASALIQNIRAVTREHYDYSAFLRKFAAVNEKLRVSEDEFDYIYYTYGLSRYGNMPLIEPLEYREDRKIHDFVIAVDTSGSVAGEEVRSFIRKTYDILKSRESFDSRINVHVIQCDAEIQSDMVLTSQADLDRYMEDMEIKGFGGTDFRPVFRYVDKLLEEGDLKDLKGLIYFTDGLGTYPRRMPSYRTAFVFVESGYNIPEVPPWAMKVVLSPGEL